MTIGVLDVNYLAQGARAACVIAVSWEAATAASACTEKIDVVEPYAPGEFYRRELPCLLAVLRRLPALPDVIVVDGYVWLPPGDRPGLGARLHQALGGTIPVVGIAKTAFAGAEAAAAIVPVLRGNSRRPLFVTAIGMEPALAAQCVSRMAGPDRIPLLVKLADRLAKDGAYANCMQDSWL